MAKLADAHKFKGVHCVYRDDNFSLSRAVEIANGSACWLYRTRNAIDASCLPAAQQIEQAKKLSHTGVVPLGDCGIDRNGHGFMTVTHTAAQPLSELIQSKPPSEIFLLVVLLSLTRTLGLSEAKGVGHRSLHPAFIFIESEQLVGPNSKPVSVAIAGFGAPALMHTRATPKVIDSLFLARLALVWLTGDRCFWRATSISHQLSLPVSPACKKLLEGCLQANTPCNSRHWLDVERRILLALNGRHLNSDGQALFSVLRQSVKVQQPSWHIMDFRPLTDGFDSVWFEQGSSQWHRLVIVATGEGQLKRANKQLKPLIQRINDGQFIGIDALWAFEVNGNAWACTSVRDAAMSPLTDLMGNVNTAERVYPIMAEICSQLMALEQNGIEIGPINEDQLLIDYREFRAQLIPVVTTRGKDSKTAIYSAAEEPVVTTQVRNLVKIAFYYLTGQRLRVTDSGVRLGTKSELPEGFREFAVRCFSPDIKSVPTLAQLQTFFAKIPKTPEPLPQSERKLVAKKLHKSNERKKLLLLLLLILLFQVMVNVGIVVGFREISVVW